MTDEGGAGRRRGLFRRNRSDDDLIDRDPLEGTLPELPPPDQEEVALWEQTAAPRPRVPKRTADMFAPKEQFSDTWSEDAWDDEWKEPAVRRTSIPPAADPTPQKVDEWLESGAEDFNDVTRDSVRKLGVDPTLAAARAIRPGSTWDDTGDVSTADGAASIDSADSALQATIERALATPPVATTTPMVAPSDHSRGAGVSKRFGRSRSSIDVSNEAISVASGSTYEASSHEAGSHEAVVDISTDSVTIDPSIHSVDPSAEAPQDALHDMAAAVNTTDAVTALDVPDELASPEAFPDREWDRPVFAPSDPIKADRTEHGAPVISDLSADSPRDLPADIATEFKTHADNADPGIADPDIADADNAHDVGPDEAGSTLTTHDFNEEIEMDSVRAHAFTDRASWIGTGLGGVAAARLALHVASNMKQADPADAPIGALARIGGGFANAGVMHGLLLIAAVTLLSLPALFNREDFVPRRTGAGLGLVLGAALVGLLGGAVALITQTSLADALGAKVTVGSTGEILAALALSAVAVGATMRALRSFSE